ncbi:T9SS type A sorting domain-containing protein [Chryseobacterium formosus]|uniref:T9SS type A sorting domain-containing protein n=1 Tax=Chryseobacterium formosus TaxID=1537363 RepID=A0ABT3XUV8_9FLAO|nr:T9SS type A sorting domain-containing protein [Chryseobacterium formosus]MCX8525452.1 T9SS type A sorting domain-containing protein [Chryseobacterium formosus]
MKKTLLSIAVLAVNLFYSQVTIGSGTRTDSNVGLSTPISIYYGYSLSQQIYLASEIGPAMNIQQLKFYVQNPITSLSNTAQVDVWIGHTNATSFQNVVSTTGAGWIPVSQQQKVLTTGTLSYTGNEVTITLATPFAYNGTQNLVITVDENAAGHNGNTYPFYQTVDYTNDVTLINRSDTVNPDPLNPPTNYTGPNSTATTEVQGKKYKAILTLIAQNLGVADARTVGDASITPNPASDFVTIKTKLTIDSVDILDLNGRKVLNNLSLNNDKIDIRELSSGVYMLKINYKEGLSTTKKIIKK